MSDQGPVWTVHVWLTNGCDTSNTERYEMTLLYGIILFLNSSLKVNFLQSAPNDDH